MTNEEWKKQALEALDLIIDIYNAKMEECWEDEEKWNYLEEIRTNLLIARRVTASLP